MKKIKRSEKYYIDRFVKQENIAHELSLTKQKELRSIYREARKELETNLAFFIERYTEENELSPADLKRMLNTKEKANFRYSVKKYVEEIERLGADTKEGKALKKELDILAGRTRVSRKEELIATLNAELSKTSMKVNKSIGQHLKDVVSYGYKDTFLAMSNTLAKLDTKLIERIVAQKWSGKNYSDRIWKNKNNLVKRLVKNITVGLAQGFEFKKMSERLARDLDVGFYEARRIIETETTGALENAKAQAFKDMGISKYKFIATLDDRTSEICRSLNGQVFEMKDRQVGINCPFCHPFCRSITVPVVDKKAEAKIDEIKENDLKEKGKNNENSLKNEKKNGIIKKEVKELNPLTYEELKYSNPREIVLKTKEYKKWKKSILASEENSLKSYTGNAYKKFNRYLRGDIEEIDNADIQDIKSLEKALTRFETARDYTLYRGSPNKFNIKDLNVGDEVVLDRAFLSTSFNMDVARSFTNGSDTPVIYQIRLPKGKRVGSYIQEYSKYDYEEEFLLKPHTKFKILKLEIKEDEKLKKITHFYDLEVIE